MENNESIQLVAKEMDMNLQAKDPQQWINELVGKINSLLAADFGRLVNILYRMDVSESKLKQLLKDNPGEDAAKLIALLMIERQAEKIRSRQQFSGDNKNIDEEDKW